MQALGNIQDVPPSVTVLEQEVSTVEEFVYLGALIHSHSFPDIMRWSKKDKQLRQSRISLSTKLRLYNTCILPIFLYGSECWVITKEDTCRINALHQWCLSMLLGIKWYHFISNDEVRLQTNQPLLTEIIQAQRLTLFGHIAQMDDNVDAKQISTSSPSVYWKRPPGRPRMTWMKTTSTPTGCHEPTQSTWPRTDHSGGCWQPVVLRTRSGARRRRRLCLLLLFHLE